jgi:antitoxin component YwqK of YwqJK toxin-antitoxin module
MIVVSACSPGTEKNDNKTVNKDSIQNTMRDSVIAEHTDSIPPVWTGDYVKKYPNGVVMMHGEYKYGKRWGQWQSFYQDGKLWSEGYYKDGKREGKGIVYYPNGQKHLEGVYTAGRMTGKWNIWSEDGKEHKEVDYGK